jgi:3-hydroxybutyryl-CoA dehydrogenase
MVLTGLETTTALSDLKGCHIVIEAATEEMSLKKTILTALGGVLKKDTVIATNTSSLSINELAGAVSNPARFIGMHFMNPPKPMKLVEVVRGEKTSEETITIIKDLARKIGKTPVVVKDSPGFVTNRLLFALIGEAMRLLEKKAACKTAIDRIMRYGMNHPMGPIELADFIGLDICEKIMDNLYNSLGDERYRPPAILRDLVRRGKLGKKSGGGFYRYQKGTS